MKIIGFPVDASRSQDDRLVRDLQVKNALLQAALDLIRVGDVEPTAVAIAKIAGVSDRAILQQFASLGALYAAAFDLAVSRAFECRPPADRVTPLTGRVELLVSDRSELFEEWLPLWHFAGRVQGVAPDVGLGGARLRKLLRERLAAWFAPEFDRLHPTSRDLVLDALDVAFGLDAWMNMRDQLRLSPVRAAQTWRFTLQAIVARAFAGAA